MSTHLSMNPTTTSETPTVSSTTLPPTTTAVYSVAPLPSDTKAGAAAKRDSGLNESYPAPVATYEEVAQNAEVFFRTLKDLHGSFGTKLMVPKMGGKALDLHRLFVEVTARGGLEKVIENRKWREITAVLSFPATITNASFTLRKYYLSLLHQYEQVYYFGREHQAFSLTNIGNSPVSGTSTLQIQGTTPEDGTNENRLQAQSEILPRPWVTGTIDGKFDYGYLVTVNIGSEKLKGVLYHVPVDVEAPHTNASLLPSRRNLKRSRRADHPNRNGYNFFFAEQYARLKSSQDDERQELNICRFSTEIGNLWSQLSEAEKQVYRDKSLTKQGEVLSGLNP